MDFTRCPVCGEMLRVDTPRCPRCGKTLPTAGVARPAPAPAPPSGGGPLPPGPIELRFEVEVAEDLDPMPPPTPADPLASMPPPVPPDLRPPPPVGLAPAPAAPPPPASPPPSIPPPAPPSWTDGPAAMSWPPPNQAHGHPGLPAAPLPARSNVGRYVVIGLVVGLVGILVLAGAVMLVGRRTDDLPSTYTPELEDGFLRGCTNTGGTTTQCRCLLDEVEREYSVSELVEISDEILDSGEYPPELVAMGQRCT